jgi:hypothetical protein
MMIKKDGKISIIAGREGFRSAFRSNNRKIRNTANKKLVTEMRERGYYSNGKPGPKFPTPAPFDPEKFAENPEKGWAQMTADMEGLTAILQVFSKGLGKEREPIEFWGNPDIGQRIPVETLMIATDFWPLDEVLEMVPTK